MELEDSAWVFSAWDELNAWDVLLISIRHWTLGLFIKRGSYNVSLQCRALLLGTAFVLTNLTRFCTLRLKQVRRVIDLAVEIKDYNKTSNVICSAVSVIIRRYPCAIDSASYILSFPLDIEERNNNSVC